jgi:pimeloyl-ACP methyl ester carboxylesterase
MSPEKSVFKSPEGEAKSLAAYDAALACWPVPYEERDIATRFGATHLVVSGPMGAKPLVLLHGQDSSATSWLHNIADLSRDFRCYAVDTVGDLGKSKPTRMPASRKDYADWLSDVFEAVKIASADVMGLSYGGSLAVNFALAQPLRVRRMVLLAPGITNFGPMTLQWANYGLPMMLHPSRYTIRRFINGASIKGYSVEDPVQEQMIVGMANLRNGSFMRPVFSDQELGQISAPTLLLIGDHEIMYEPRKAIQHAMELIPNLQAELIRDAGHMLNGDQPEIVNRRILKFLSPEADEITVQA